MNRDIDRAANDTEGHMPFKRGLEEASPDDLVGEAGDDAEGHAAQPGRPHRKGVEPGDAEGHMPLRKSIEEASPEDLVDESADDAQGHAFRHGIDEAGDDTEGHSAKFRP